MARVAGKVYGDAWFSYAKESGRLEALYEESAAVCDLLVQYGELNRLLCSPVLDQEQKTDILKQTFEGRIDETLLAFLRLLMEKGHFRELPAVFSHFQDCYKEYKKIGVVSVQTAAPLSDGQKGRIEARILETTPYERLEVSYEVKPALIGGLVIRIRDRVVDSSIQTQLEHMKKQLLTLQL